MASLDHPMPNLPQRNMDPLDKALQSLGRMTSVLRVFAIAIPIITLSVLCYGVYIFLLLSRDSKITDRASLFDNVYIFVAVAFISILLILLREFYRRKGDVLFEEIGDELASAKSPDVPPRLSPLEIRLVLRSFAHAVDLPLVPGKFGALTYFVINLLMVIIVVLRY
jgi:hypothetical protein